MNIKIYDLNQHLLGLVLLIFCGTLLMPSLRAQGVGEELIPHLGIYQPRIDADGKSGYINLRIVRNNFRLYFLKDDQKTIEEPAFPYAIVQYGNAIKKIANELSLRLSLEPGGVYLTNQRIIAPPHRYSVRVILMNRIESDFVDESTNNTTPPPGAKKEVFKVIILNQLVQEDKGDTDPTMGTHLGN